MTGQSDFWKPAPYDFEAVVDRVNFQRTFGDHVSCAASHGFSRVIRNSWARTEQEPDKWDADYFYVHNMGPELDLWDNRRKGARQ
jgi:arylsulfatase A-like enzyme